MELLIIGLIIWGIFALYSKSGCVHDYHWHTARGGLGFWGDKVKDYHKCSKCGKIEECNRDGRISGNSQHAGDPCCTKCSCW